MYGLDCHAILINGAMLSFTGLYELMETCQRNGEGMTKPYKLF